MKVQKTGLLRYEQDRRSILFCFLFLLLVGVGYRWGFRGPAWVPILLISLCCVSCFLIGTIAHNSMHHPIFYDSRLNRGFQIFLSVCYGHPVSVYVSGHNFSHHLNTQSSRDVIRTDKARFRWHLLNQLLFFFLVIPSLVRAEKQFKSQMKDEFPEWYKQFCVEQRSVYLVQLILLVLNWQCFFAYVWLPQLYCVWGIIGINMVQHDGCDPTHAYNHTRSMTGRWINWWTFNNGYHCAHHLRPNMHWTEYPAFHEKHVAPYLHPALAQDNLIVYLFRTYIFPGKRVSFEGLPVTLPAPTEDGDWIPTHVELQAKGASLGAISLERGSFKKSLPCKG